MLDLLSIQFIFSQYIYVGLGLCFYSILFTTVIYIGYLGFINFSGKTLENLARGFIIGLGGAVGKKVGDIVINPGGNNSNNNGDISGNTSGDPKGNTTRGESSGSNPNTGSGGSSSSGGDSIEGTGSTNNPGK